MKIVCELGLSIVSTLSSSMLHKSTPVNLDSALTNVDGLHETLESTSVFALGPDLVRVSCSSQSAVHLFTITQRPVDCTTISGFVLAILSGYSESVNSQVGALTFMLW